jgi:hypothetical protein
VVVRPPGGGGDGKKIAGLLAAGIAAVLLGVLAGVVFLGEDESPDESGVAVPPSLSPASSSTTIPSSLGTPASAQISRISIVDGRYSVDFSTSSLTLNGIDNVIHVHFFFDSVPVSAAGVPGPGPWFVYGAGSPFTGYAVSERPPGANQMCVLVANPDHSVRPATGNCVRLP